MSGEAITDLDPAGFVAEVSGPTIIEVACKLGIPVSTTHAITSAILGVGATHSLRAVRWGVTLEIFFSWLLTVPPTVLLGALYLFLLRAMLGS
jgi:inorganic phosphate transporter, PiT family